jgi:hypothetical protein
MLLRRSTFNRSTRVSAQKAGTGAPLAGFGALDQRVKPGFRWLSGTRLLDPASQLKPGKLESSAPLPAAP